MTTRLLRIVATMVFLSTFSLHASARAQTSEAPAETADADATVAPPLDAATVAQETWAARVEYHRQLRSTDLSELSSGASTLGFGIYSMTRDEPFSRGMGGAMLAGGGIHIISGVIFSIRSQRGMRDATPPPSFLEGDPLARELDLMEHRTELFLAVLLGDASVISAGIATALAGIARDKPVTQGVGLGLASQGVLTLVLDLAHQSQGGAYLRKLRDLNMRFQIDRARIGNGATVSVAWSR